MKLLGLPTYGLKLTQGLILVVGCHICDSPSCFQLYGVQEGGLAIKEYIERKTLQKTHKNGMHIVGNILNCRNEM